MNLFQLGSFPFPLNVDTKQKNRKTSGKGEAEHGMVKMQSGYSIRLRYVQATYFNFA